MTSFRLSPNITSRCDTEMSNLTKVSSATLQQYCPTEGGFVEFVLEDSSVISSVAIQASAINQESSSSCIHSLPSIGVIWLAAGFVRSF